MSEQQYSLRIDFDVNIMTKLPVTAPKRILLNQTETWIAYKLREKINLLEEEINNKLHQEAFLLPTEKIILEN